MLLFFVTALMFICATIVVFMPPHLIKDNTRRIAFELFVLLWIWGMYLICHY